MNKHCPQCQSEYVFKWSDLFKREFKCSCGATLKMNYNKYFITLYLLSSFIVPFVLFHLVVSHSILSVFVNTFCILAVGYLGGMYFGRLTQ
ncbi:hypothetical protein [Peredibacter starrii]|uniref:CXXC-20-CXXC protein n=1 Tax=Peredibacter starrii TaxID=28202 RepID=A0AAX4HLG5_9BACT|nr:hypothetical protein [Peredibacter starrii]WPU64137.1 hypothetical protein SOO65_15695 [Peredibacter starrii]